MANKDQITEQIEAYLAGEMSPGERKAFETRLSEDQTLAEELRLQQGTHRLLQLYTQIDYKEKLRIIDAEMETEGKVVSLNKSARFSQRWMAIAAVVILLIASGWILTIFQYDPARIGAAQFEPYRDVITYKGDALPSDSLILAAMAHYNLKDYAAAKKTLETTLAAYPQLADARFYLAMSLLAENENAKAIEQLTRLTGDHKYGEVSQWYLALAWLKADKRERSVELLQKIAETDGHGYQEKARELLVKLTGFVWKIPGVG